MDRLNYSPKYIQLTGNQAMFKANNSPEFELILHLLIKYMSLRSQLESTDIDETFP